ncbi:hypothetical protein UVI_02036880 [Ustilaginoidea virens]|uniref:Uncharacterized protein n=1 Tax=Ustilaginoidea virens TaxID=1159556 RepID=A0A1B5L407_USTVR|nr:hypothetical protein UVI_02036880 [Ustilaginoidea virens]
MPGCQDARKSGFQEVRNQEVRMPGSQEPGGSVRTSQGSWASSFRRTTRCGRIDALAVQAE